MKKIFLITAILFSLVFSAFATSSKDITKAIETFWDKGTYIKIEQDGGETVRYINKSFIISLYFSSDKQAFICETVSTEAYDRIHILSHTFENDKNGNLVIIKTETW